jgi:hypothetical protein
LYRPPGALGSLAVETEPPPSESIDRLEEEVAVGERRLAALAASIRAARVETAAARDPAQFYPDAIGRPPSGERADGYASRGFICGIAVGVGVSLILSLILRLVIG